MLASDDEVQLTKREISVRLLALLTEGSKLPAGDRPLGLRPRRSRRLVYADDEGTPEAGLSILCELVLEKFDVPNKGTLQERFRLLSRRFAYDVDTWKLCLYLAEVP